MADESDTTLALLDDKSTVTMYIGTFVSTDGNTVTVDINGGRVPAKVATSYRPEVNEAVRIMSVDGDFYMLGPTLPKPPIGTVTAVGATTVTLDTDAGVVTATYGAGESMSAGQIVKIYWSGGAHVISVLATPPAANTPPDAPSTGATRHVDVFTALDAGSGNSGSWSGWWQRQVWASDTTVGAWFYGSKIRDTIHGGTVSKIEIFASLAQKYGSNPNIGTHAYGSKPSGAPTISSATAVPVASGTWVTLPTAFGTFLASNVGGIGTLHGGFNKFRSLSEDPQSGALRITSTY